MDKIKFEEIINKHIPWFENRTAKNWDAETLLRDFAAELLQADSSQFEPQVMQKIADIEGKYPCEVGQTVMMEDGLTYDEVRLANYYRRQGAIWLLNGGDSNFSA